MYTLTPERYILSEAGSIQPILKRLQKKLVLEKEVLHQRRAVFYDSFDWRLYRQGYLLEERQQDKQTALFLHHINTAEVLLTDTALVSYQHRPFFANALPEGEFYDTLAPLLRMRALLPLVEVQTQRHCFRVLNKDRKTVLRLAFDYHSALPVAQRGMPKTKADPAPALQTMPCRVQLLPVRGYRSALNKVQAEFARNESVQVAERSVLDDALAAIGREALDYSSKLSLKLAPDMSTLSALQTTFLILLNTIRINEHGLGEDIDSEFLHDFRLAIRRTRSALSQVKKVFPEETLQHFKAEFAWLDSATDECRDLDVYLLSFDRYRQALPMNYQDALLPFRDFLLRHKQKARADLLKVLDSKRYRRLLKQWDKLHRDTKVTATLSCEACQNRDLPIHDVAAQRILHLFKHIIKNGRNIHPETADGYVHEVRIECKKLGYLLEFFKNLYPPKKIKRLIKSLKCLQSNLDAINDVAVHAENLHVFSQQMFEEKQGTVETLLAMGALISQLTARKEALRADFPHQFKQFDTPAMHQTVDLLFGAHTSDGRKTRKRQ